VGYATTNDSTTNERYNEQLLSIKSGCYKEQMLQRTRRNTIGRRSTSVRKMCRAFPLWLERQSSPVLSFVRFSYQFRSDGNFAVGCGPEMDCP
jgi:hypothetical protein